MVSTGVSLTWLLSLPVESAGQIPSESVLWLIGAGATLLPNRREFCFLW